MKITRGLILLCAFMFIGCEDPFDSSRSSGDPKLIKLECRIERLTEIPLIPGDAGFYDCGQYWIRVDGDTFILRIRDSCSGFDQVPFSGAKQKDIIFVTYDPDEADYSGTPAIIKAHDIEAWRPECREF